LQVVKHLHYIIAFHSNFRFQISDFRFQILDFRIDLPLVSVNRFQYDGASPVPATHRSGGSWTGRIGSSPPVDDCRLASSLPWLTGGQVVSCRTRTDPLEAWD
jgi:hypothetical protein